MPTGGAVWRPTRQPVVLELWPVEPPQPGRPFTTVMSWKSFRDVEYEGRVFGQKDRQFEDYYSLPAGVGEDMQLAVRAPAQAAQRLRDGGWSLVNPLEVTYGPSSYQRYIQTSRAEFSLASHAYVSTRCGWFSDRTTAYLASGRPAVVQDTGFSEWLPSGAGVVPFVTREDAIDAIADINGRDEFHCREARRLAEDYFDARHVLTGLIDRAMSSSD